MLGNGFSSTNSDDKEKLSQKIVKIEHNITLELENSTQKEAKTHEDMMKKTVDNIKKQQQRLNETKKRKLEGLLHPPEKRSRQGEQMRKWTNGRNYQRQTQAPYHKRNQQKQSNSTNPKNKTSTPYQTPHSGADLGGARLVSYEPPFFHDEPPFFKMSLH